jgi:hypothetical protein
VLEDPESGPENGWVEGNVLQVCAVAKGGALTGFTPVPDEIVDRVSMRIEHDVTGNGTAGQAGTTPVGGWASRC